MPGKADGVYNKMELINYADLTYPEVAELPRHVPLVIPLGLDIYDYSWLAHRLQAEQLVCLPAVPFGFQASAESGLARLAVDPGLMQRVMWGICGELAAQGFQRIYFVSGRDEPELVAGGLNFMVLPSGDASDQLAFDPRRAIFPGHERTRRWLRAGLADIVEDNYRRARSELICHPTNKVRPALRLNR